MSLSLVYEPRCIKERVAHARELGDALLMNLSLIGESRYGRGLLSHVLLTKDDAVRTKCAIALAFVVRYGKFLGPATVLASSTLGSKARRDANK